VYWQVEQAFSLRRADKKLHHRSVITWHQVYFPPPAHGLERRRTILSLLMLIRGIPDSILRSKPTILMISMIFLSCSRQVLDPFLKYTSTTSFVVRRVTERLLLCTRILCLEIVYPDRVVWFSSVLGGKWLTTASFHIRYSLTSASFDAIKSELQNALLQKQIHWVDQCNSDAL
jgi:hypothetical protein